jgi:hypothetical protein
MTGAADVLRWIEAALGLAAAGYTAFLFDQCEGRDLWQSRLLLPHLIAQAVMCGAACLALFAAPLTMSLLIGVAAAAHGMLACVERFGKHATTNATQAAAFLGTVRVGPVVAWPAGLGLGLVGAAIGMWYPWLGLAPVLVGLFLYEWAYIRAGQLPPLS